MQHSDQHAEAIKRTICVRNEVSASFFDDKVREAGTVTVANGKIHVVVDSLPGITSGDAVGEFLAESIKLAILACWKARPEAFERLS